jgi:hypothetical protein
MSYQALADVAVVLHFGFLVFLVVGGFVALRWRALAWVHLAAVAWSIGIVTIGQRCPLTSLERWATVRAGGQAQAAGFIDRYVKGVVYPASLTGLVRVGVAVIVVASWVLLWRGRPVAREFSPTGWPSAPDSPDVRQGFGTRSVS